jgi:putative peptidoglycan lipid II flippase
MRMARPTRPGDGSQEQPTLPPDRDETPSSQRRAGKHAAPRKGAAGDGEDQPRPTSDPWERYFRPPDSRQRAAYPPQTASPPGPGIPQNSTQPFHDPEPLPRRGAPRGGRPPDGGDDRTLILEVPWVPEGPGTGSQPRVATRPNLARSSAVMAAGTFVSRGTGFLRTFILLYAIGTGGLADAYNNSNALPQTVYYLFLGGVFTSVMVPLMVKAAKNHPDRGEAYAERIFTLGVVALLTVTVVGTLLAGSLVDLYAGNLGSSPTAVAEHAQMVLLAHFAMPQIFFFGMDSLLGAILNTRGRFGANMWTPVINNVVVIVVGGLYLVTAGTNRTPSTISSGSVKLLGIGTTLGIVIQSIALFPVLRRAGFSMRLRTDFRRGEVSEIIRMAGWMVGYVVSQWAGYLVVQRVANVASGRPGAAASGYAAYSYGWSLFQLPYAVVGISVISALLPRMSGHASDRRYSLVREDFSTGVRLASVIVVPAALFLAVLGAPLCEFLFSYGSTNVNEARYIGEVFGMLSLGLVPFMLTQLQLRVFYSFQDNKTPAIIGMFMLGVNVAGALLVLNLLPAGRVVIGLAAVYGLVTLTGALLAWPLLLRRVGSLDGWRVTRSLIRMLLACVPGLIFAFLVMRVFGALLSPGRVYGFASTVIGGGGALLLYAGCARALGIEEFRTLLRSLGGRLGHS